MPGLRIVLLVHGVVLTLASTSLAGVLLPTPLFELGEIDAASNTGLTVVAEAGPSEATRDPQPAEDDRVFRCLDSSPNATTSGASLNSGGSSTACSCLVSLRADITKDDSLSWRLGEFSLSIPDEPGSDLIKPPQHVV